jgi:hypothetical protein
MILSDLLFIEITLQSLPECSRCEDVAYHSEHRGTSKIGKMINILVLALMIEYQ